MHCEFITDEEGLDNVDIVFNLEYDQVDLALDVGSLGHFLRDAASNQARFSLNPKIKTKARISEKQAKELIMELQYFLETVEKKRQEREDAD